MTSATTQPASGQHAERRGYGLVLFASVMLVIIGCFNLIYGIAAIANSHVFTANVHHVFAGLRTWGWITLIIGVLQLPAAAGVLAGSQLARWFAVAVLGVNAIDMMFFLPAYPFWALVILAADVVALYGLCAYGSRANWKPPNPKGGMVMRDIRASVEVRALIGGDELRELHRKAFAQYECWQCGGEGRTAEATSVIVVGHRAFRVVMLAHAACADPHIIEVSAGMMSAVAGLTVAPPQSRHQGRTRRSPAAT